MASQTYPLPARFSRWLLACAVRHWPEETRPWGEALAAEMEETTDALETLLWSWGGIMLFARSVVGSVMAWLKLPVGSGTSGGPVVPSNLPKRSRLLTAVILIAAAALFMSAEGREAIRTIRASWGNISQQSPADRRVLEKLAARAEKENDATMLAFVAMTIDDPDRATVLADRAVSLNPQLIWIYGTTRLSPAGRDERLQRLRAADPGNAAPVILAADSEADRIGAIFPQHLSPTQIEAMLAANPKWMELMRQAFALSRFDNYEQRRFQLTGDVWNRERYLSPAIVYGEPSWPHGNPYGDLWIFATIRVHGAEKAFAAGEAKEGERLLSEEDSFGERMADDPNSTLLGKAVGLDLVNSANFELAQVYTRAGQTAEAQKAGSRIQQVKNRQTQLFQRDVRIARLNTFHRAGFFVQCFGSLAIVAGFAALAGILTLEMLPVTFRNRNMLWRKILCWTANYAPAATLIAGSASLLSFMPLAHAFAEYRTSTSSLASHEIFIDAIMGCGPWYAESWLWHSWGIFWSWCLVVVALGTLATFIVIRSIYQIVSRPVTT